MVRSRHGWWLIGYLLVGCGETAQSTPAASESAGGAGGARSEGAEAAGASGESTEAAGSSSDSAAGSGSEGAITAYFEPGTRLKPQVLALDDGVEVIEGSADSGWYDSDLGIDCFFVADPEGIERCFPRQLLTGALYTDADCSRPVLPAGVLHTCRALRYPYVLQSTGGCTFRGFRVADELSVSTPLFSSDGTSCQPTSTMPELAPIYQLEELPAETFVGMTRSARPRAPGLDAYVREGDDGSWQIIGHFDQARKASCFGPLPIFSPRSECLPAFVSSQRFADATCQTRAAETRQSSCRVEAPTALLHGSLNTEECPAQYDLALYELGPTEETALHEVDASGTCVPSALPVTESYIQGAPLDLMTLPVLETQVVGSGTARALFSGFGGVPYLPIWYTGPSLVDATGAACTPIDFPDGSARCVPSDFATSSPAAFAYEDEACGGEPLVPWFPRSTCLSNAPLPGSVLFPDQTTECLDRPTASELRAVIGKSSASTFYAKASASGACQAIDQTSPAPTYLRMGDVIAPQDLPRLQRTIHD